MITWWRGGWLLQRWITMEASCAAVLAVFSSFCVRFGYIMVTANFFLHKLYFLTIFKTLQAKSEVSCLCSKRIRHWRNIQVKDSHEKYISLHIFYNTMPYHRSHPYTPFPSSHSKPQGIYGAPLGKSVFNFHILSVLKEQVTQMNRNLFPKDTVFWTISCGTFEASLNTETVFQWVENLEFCKGREKFRGLPSTHCLVTLCGTLYNMHRLEKRR